METQLVVTTEGSLNPSVGMCLMLLFIEVMTDDFSTSERTCHLHHYVKKGNCPSLLPPSFPPPLPRRIRFAGPRPPGDIKGCLLLGGHCLLSLAGCSSVGRRCRCNFLCFLSLKKPGRVPRTGGQVQDPLFRDGPSHSLALARTARKHCTH